MGTTAVGLSCESIWRCSEDGSPELEVTELGRDVWTVDALLTAGGSAEVMEFIGTGSLFFDKFDCCLC